MYGGHLSIGFSLFAWPDGIGLKAMSWRSVRKHGMTCREWGLWPAHGGIEALKMRLFIYHQAFLPAEMEVYTV